MLKATVGARIDLLRSIWPNCLILSITLTLFVGPLLDDGAPYSGIGLLDFKLIQPFMLPDWSGAYDPLPDFVKNRPVLAIWSRKPLK